MGTGLLTEKLTPCEVPPPGAGLETVTDATAPSSSLSAGILAVRLVVLPKAVARSMPFHCTADWLTNPVPTTVMDRSGEPAVTDDGLRLVIAGAAFPVDVVGGGVVAGGVDADCELVLPQPAVHNGRTIRQATANYRGRRPAKIIRALPIAHGELLSSRGTPEGPLFQQRRRQVVRRLHARDQICPARSILVQQCTVQSIRLLSVG